MHAYNCFRLYLQYDVVLLFAVYKSSYDSRTLQFSARQKCHSNELRMPTMSTGAYSWHCILKCVGYHFHHIVQNSGVGKLWQIWQNECHSLIFYPAKFQCWLLFIHQHFPHENPETISLSKFYPTIILHYMVYSISS